MTYKKMFPKLFKYIDEMPASLKSHVRYPHSLFKIQADVYGRYHMNDVKVFYQNEDLWEVLTKSTELARERQSLTTLLPEFLVKRRPNFVSMLPYSPKSKAEYDRYFDDEKRWQKHMETNALTGSHK